jgi:hypothetical protein
MVDTCKTVTIKTKNGPVEINESDFDAKVHVLWDEPKQASPKARK